MDRQEELKKYRQVFRGTFNTPDGIEVLGAMLNRLGYFSGDADTINPDLIAFANWILYNLGVTHGENIFIVAEKLVEASNDLDMEGLDDLDT